MTFEAINSVRVYLSVKLDYFSPGWPAEVKEQINPEEDYIKQKREAVFNTMTSCEGQQEPCY